MRDINAIIAKSRQVTWWQYYLLPMLHLFSRPDNWLIQCKRTLRDDTGKLLEREYYLVKAGDV